MSIVKGEFYHVFNQGNNRERIFIQERNYSYFLKLVEKFIKPNCDILCYCLMPNHFHFMIHANGQSIEKIKVGSLTLAKLTNGFRVLQSSYAQAINKQESRTGSLFRQKTKFKLLEIENSDYAWNCFNYIHQNPLRAKLVSNLKDWEFSSFRFYSGYSKFSICNDTLAIKLLDINETDFEEESLKTVDDAFLK